MQEILDMLYFF